MLMSDFYINKRQLETSYLIIGILTIVFFVEMGLWSVDPDSVNAWLISFVWRGDRYETLCLRIIATVMFAYGGCVAFRSFYKAENETVEEYQHRRYGVIGEYICFVLFVILCVLLYARFKWEVHRPMLDYLFLR